MRRMRLRVLGALGALLALTGTALVIATTPGSAGAATAAATTSPTRLPDLRMRNLNDCPHKPCFFITTVNGVKELKFPGVTSNVGVGAFEVHGRRSSSTSTDWVARQRIYRADGTHYSRIASGVTFYYAGDGHNHWHIKDLDSYQLLNSSGTRIRIGEKHGFCFEDNTDYRDWPSNGTNGAPANPVYDPDNVCGVGKPNAKHIMHGLSVGWGDTYPSTLPNQYIDITGLPDGTYRAQVTTDQANWFRETNNSNNTAWADIRISGNSVTVLSQGGGA